MSIPQPKSAANLPLRFLLAVRKEVQTIPAPLGFPSREDIDFFMKTAISSTPNFFPAPKVGGRWPLGSSPPPYFGRNLALPGGTISQISSPLHWQNGTNLRHTCTRGDSSGQSADLLHFRTLQLPIEETHILPQMHFGTGLGDDDYALLEQPFQRHLGSGFAVVLRHCPQHRIS